MLVQFLQLPLCLVLAISDRSKRDPSMFLVCHREPEIALGTRRNPFEYRHVYQCHHLLSPMYYRGGFPGLLFHPAPQVVHYDVHVFPSQVVR
jgi:hypothetical protein